MAADSAYSSHLLQSRSTLLVFLFLLLGSMPLTLICYAWLRFSLHYLRLQEARRLSRRTNSVSHQGYGSTTSFRLISLCYTTRLQNRLVSRESATRILLSRAISGHHSSWSLFPCNLVFANIIEYLIRRRLRLVTTTCLAKIRNSIRVLFLWIIYLALLFQRVNVVSHKSDIS